jgi:hypothetical protein
MRPERLACLQPSRLSASRALMDKMIRERWAISRLSWQVDDCGQGRALYRINANGFVLDFPAFSSQPAKEGRTGRIMGRNWDMMGALIEGPAPASSFEQTGREGVKLYGGRAAPRTLNWCRANRSSRVFGHAVDMLASGRQPDIEILAQACYLMRNTGVEGNGTFGTRSFLSLEDDHPLRLPMASQMLCIYMMREFAADLLDHMAKAHSAQASSLAPEFRRFLGLGNGSALGLIFFVNNHPRLMDRWISSHEAAVVAAKSIRGAALRPALERLRALLAKAIVFRRQDRMYYESFAASSRIADELALIARGIDVLIEKSSAGPLEEVYPISALCATYEPMIHAETLETLHALLIELVPDIADALRETFIVDEELNTRPVMSLGRLRDILHDEYAWALGMDVSSEASRRYVWYKAETAEEPRRGPREEVPDAFNLGLDLPWLIQKLDAALVGTDHRETVARFLLRHPEHRAIVARVQGLAGLRYHSPHMNIMGEEFLPVHMVRMLTAGFFGKVKTRDYLHRNVRGVLMHGAPLPEDLRAGADPDWFFPMEPGT